ncbi:MAG TPA: BON domain-containing protein [Candidatus Sulfopaludibacter sp.]|jgi:hyperosmotically inducible protein|nr:BON domain-containing protein [Candidatus Sulfopaludibacter sp.]
MKPKILGMMLLGASLVLAASKPPKPEPGTDAAIVAKVRHEVLSYPYFTIFDDISYRVENGHVELLGEVSQPYKKSDLAHIVRDIPGVTSVSDSLKVLPLSDMDNRLRLQIARAIYRDPMFTRYAMEAVPPIHIIVENGHVTLTGVVSTQMEKEVAAVRAASSMSFGPVVNNLQVENPPVKKS